jgi:hypothetical protein
MALVTTVPHPEATPPYVDVTVTWDSDGQVTLTRRDPDRAWPVRGAEPIAVTAGQSVTVRDFECPFGVDVHYQAGAGPVGVAEQGFTRLIPTAYYPNDQEWSTLKGAAWLRHLAIPQLSMAIDLANAESPVFAQTRTVAPVLNRPSPIVLADGRRKNPTSTLDIRTWSLEEADKFRALLADNSTLLLDVPAGERWGITHWWVSVGDVTEERLIQEWAPFEGRVFHLPVEIVDRPAGGVIYPSCCYWTEQRGLVSYLQLPEHRPTYGDMASCGLGNTGDDDSGDPDVPAPVALDDVTETNNLGAFGSTSTTMTPGGPAPDQQGQATFNHQTYPFIVCSSTAYFEASKTYTISGETFYLTPDANPNTITQTVMAVPGPDPATSGGIVLDSHGRTNVDSYANLYYEGSGPGGYPTFSPPADGVYTITCVLTGTGTFSSAFTGYTRWLMSFSANTPGTTTTTTTPGDAITLRSYPNLTAGKTYRVDAQEMLTAGDQTVYLALKWHYGATDDATMKTANVIYTLPCPPGGNYTVSPGTDTFIPAQSGVHEFALHAYSAGIFSDSTDTYNPRLIRVFEAT